MTTTPTTQRQQKRKFLLILPLLVIPFLFLAFYALGGGKGNQEDKPEKGAGMGFNMELPPPVFDRKEGSMNKMAFYSKADADSVRKRTLRLQDPNIHPPIGQAFPLFDGPRSDTQADALLKRLDHLKRHLPAPSTIKRSAMERTPMRQEAPTPTNFPSIAATGLARRTSDVDANDPELEKLNAMLDKIARLQKDVEPDAASVSVENKRDRKNEIDTATTVSIPAVVVQDQQLSNGATLALRLTAPLSYNGITLPEGQLVYGIAGVNNDRLQVSIRSIRHGLSILNTTWQVYDMDGLPGIHIPDGLGRQVARQSADQTIGALNLSAYDPSLGAQVTNAGIQAARTFFSRKIRTIKVLIPAGYRVLIKDSRPTGSTLRILPDTTNVMERSNEVVTAPSIDSLKPFLHKSVTEGGISLVMRGIYQREGLIWFYLTVSNHSPFPFIPHTIQYSDRREKHIKRIAVQEFWQQPQYDSLPSVVGSGDEQPLMIGVKPMMIPKGKRMVIQLCGRDDGRILELAIKGKSIKKYIWEKGRSL